MDSKTINKYLERTGFREFNPKAVLFDMDGVLINSMPNHAIAWQRSMASFGINMSKEDAYATEGARGVDTIRKMVKAQQGRDIDALELHEKIFHTGLQICIVTGSGQRPLINRLLEEFPRVTKERLVTAYDVKNGKPLPDPYLAGMKKCNVMPWETIVVENAPLGVMSGAASKAFTIAANTGPLPDSALWDAGADMVLDSYNVIA